MLIVAKSKAEAERIARDLEAALHDADELNRGNAAAEIFGSIGVEPSSEEAKRIIALRLASPKRAEPGRIIQPQADPAHLPLFVAANEPSLL